jgi:hypothetical protein
VSATEFEDVDLDEYDVNMTQFKGNTVEMAEKNFQAL